jgi:hypothetical protein
MAKRALLVGINDYAPQGAGGSDLEGCVNDVREMADTLLSVGFATPAIEVVTDAKATAAGILDGLGWLTKKALPGDTLVFYYSGHGSQVADTSGDEPDRKDEILCPHDTDFSRKVWVSDDQLKEAFSALPPGALLEVILDSCHSGTGTREAAIIASLGGRVVRDRFLEPPACLAGTPCDGAGGWARDILRAGEAAPDRILWAACKDAQTSQETVIDGKVRGIFTYHFCRVLRGSLGGMSRKEVSRIVRDAVKRGGYVQTPQLECAHGRLDVAPFR